MSLTRRGFILIICKRSEVTIFVETTVTNSAANVNEPIFYPEMWLRNCSTNAQESQQSIVLAFCSQIIPNTNVVFVTWRGLS